MPNIEPNSHLDWFMNPLPAERCKSTAAVKALNMASEDTTKQVLALLQAPDSQIQAGLRKLQPDQLTRLNDIVKAAHFHVKPLGSVYYTPPS